MNDQPKIENGQPKIDVNDQPKIDHATVRLQRYQARLGFWQPILVTLISGVFASGIAIAIPNMVEAYKAHLEIDKTKEEQKLKQQEIALKDRELQGKIFDSHNTFLSKFVLTALDQDIELRLRFSEYFAAVSDPPYRDGWEKLYMKLKERRDQLRELINQKERQRDKIRTRRSLLDLDEQTELAQLDRELTWLYGELGYFRKDSNVSVPIAHSLDDLWTDFNGALVPVTTDSLINIFGAPTVASKDSSPCPPIDGAKFRANVDTYTASDNSKLELIGPAASPLRRITERLMQDDPDLAKTLSFEQPRCAFKAGTLNVESWLVTVTIGGKYRNAIVPSDAMVDALFGVGQSKFIKTPSLSIDPFLLASLEKVARYFRDEKWYWEVGNTTRQPNKFTVSASLFDQWVRSGGFK